MWKQRVSNRKSIAVSLALVTVILVSCMTSVYYPRIVQNLSYAASDEKASAVDARLVSANKEFAFDLLRELIIEDVDKDIFISPLSISMALAMVYNGAEGTTKDAMAKVLNLENMTLEEMNQEYLRLIESLETVDQLVELLIGNSVWTSKSFEPIVKPSFLQRVGTSYDSEMFTRDFGNPQTAVEINGWAEENTMGKIKEIIQNIDPAAVMFLINAIYFKGEWVTRFDEALTQSKDFFLPDGSAVKVNMMSTSGNFGYYRADDHCEVVRLPYGRDKVAMYIFLPDEDVSLDSFIANLSPTTHDEYVTRLQTVEGLIVKMPRFKLEYGVKRLNDVLKRLGMEIAFSPYGANFSGIASMDPENLYISFVDHKAVIEVNEKGTEAAAVTIVGIHTTSIGPTPYSLVVNRPFFFEIRDDRSGSVLFMGKVLNPSGT